MVRGPTPPRQDQDLVFVQAFFQVEMGVSFCRHEDVERGGTPQAFDFQNCKVPPFFPPQILSMIAASGFRPSVLRRLYIHLTS